MARKRKKKKSSIVLYVGEGDYLRGMPTRDMTIEEWEARPAELRKLGLKLGLYQMTSGPADKLDEWPEAIIDEPLPDEEVLTKDD